VRKKGVADRCDVVSETRGKDEIGKPGLPGVKKERDGTLKDGRTVEGERNGRDWVRASLVRGRWMKRNKKVSKTIGGRERRIPKRAGDSEKKRGTGTIARVGNTGRQVRR